MKIYSALILIIFVLSVIGIVVFPSVAMTVCSTRTAMCQSIIHQIDKAIGFFIGIFSSSIYSFVCLIVLSFGIYPLALSINDPDFSCVRRNFFRTYNDTSFDYLKESLSGGILEPQLYY